MKNETQPRIGKRKSLRKSSLNRRARGAFGGPVLCLGLVLCLGIASLLAAQTAYRPALPGYQYSFPRDNFNHPDFQTEWWYYTGNVKSATGHTFGFQMTFFRQAVDRSPKTDSPWALSDLYLAHLALSDIDNQLFYHRERLNRQGPGIAGIDADTGRIWNGNWQSTWHGNHQTLEAIADTFTVRLVLDALKPPVINGLNGISQKANGIGHASHYISITRLATSGKIEINGSVFAVQGTAWMDHEFFTQQLDPDQIGWDWISLQLDDNTEVMLFRLRKKDGSVDPYSSGTYVGAHGESTHLSKSDFVLEPLADKWASPISGASYPIHWHIKISPLGLDLDVTTPLASQEMSSTNRLSPTYWEGAIRFAGTHGGSPAAGVGYLEMTGYDRTSKNQ
jgi:predicted secreted hydrolase